MVSAKSVLEEKREKKEEREGHGRDRPVRSKLTTSGPEVIILLASEGNNPSIVKYCLCDVCGYCQELTDRYGQGTGEPTRSSVELSEVTPESR